MAEERSECWTLGHHVLLALSGSPFPASPEGQPQRSQVTGLRRTHGEYEKSLFGPGWGCYCILRLRNESSERGRTCQNSGHRNAQVGQKSCGFAMEIGRPGHRGTGHRNQPGAAAGQRAPSNSTQAPPLLVPGSLVPFSNLATIHGCP